MSQFCRDVVCNVSTTIHYTGADAIALEKSLVQQGKRKKKE
ncbi:hypothetical protein [Nostoc sp. FACHB-190]|nr:hypothetical protein [Nostoc sp. FACHB-190]